MSKSDELLKQIRILTIKKEELDKKIQLLLMLIQRLNDHVGCANQNKECMNDGKAVYDGYVNAIDYSYGTLAQYVGETGERKQTRYVEFVSSIEHWIVIYWKELERAIQVKNEWVHQSKLYEESIKNLWELYYQALSIGD